MKSGLLKVVLAICILAIASLACGLAVPGLSDPPATAIPVATTGSGGSQGNQNQVPTGNDNGGGNTQPSGQKLFSDNFEGRNSNWGVGSDADYNVQYVNGALQLQIFATNMKVYSGPNDATYENIRIEADAVNTGTDPKAAFGLLCNQQIITDQFYFAYITPSGGYGIVKAMFVEDDVELISGTSDLIPRNAGSYHIGLDCANGTMTLYVNGQKIDSGTDSDYANGMVGVIAWSGDVSSGTTVTFDNYVVISLP